VVLVWLRCCFESHTDFYRQSNISTPHHAA
jgi:hypothetical protein